MGTVIKNGLIFINGSIKKGDLLIEKGRIKELGSNLVANHEIDAENCLISPGLVDVHVHYRDPGQTAKENVRTGSLAAAHGGFTTVCAMPNVMPVPNTASLMARMIKNNKQNGQVHILQYGPITVNQTTSEISDYANLKQAGCFALSNDGHGVQNAQTMYLAMKKAQENNMIIAEHAQDDSLFNCGVINQGLKAQEFKVKPITELAETTQIARDLLLAQKTGVHYHVCHVSTKTSVELIRMAKAHGINVTCEVTPHHLLLNESDITQNDGNFKMNPPLRTVEDQQALIEGLLDGTIDLIATDHAPHTVSDKKGGFTQAAFGITGSETAFSQLYTHFVKTKIFSLEQLLSWMSTKPAQIFGINKAGEIAIDQPADLAIFDLKNPIQMTEQDYFSKGKNTPFSGQKVYGETRITMVAGQIIYHKKGR